MTFIRIFFNENIKTLEENKSNNFIISGYRGPKGQENQAINEKADSFDYIILLNLAKKKINKITKDNLEKNT